jgi:hypothetical protein
VPHCRRASIACVDQLARRLERMRARLDATCDHRVVPALAYLRITQALRDDIARRKPRYFTDKRYMEFVIATFSNRFFASYTRYEKGLWVPEAWKIAFDAMTRGDTTAGQDVLLFSNAHVQLWREGAWRNAERLMNASTKAGRDEIQAQIEANAATWARFIAGPVMPGYRATRDDYCRAQKDR